MGERVQNLLQRGAEKNVYPWKSKDYFLNGFFRKTIVLVRVYYQQILGNVIFMVFDFHDVNSFVSFVSGNSLTLIQLLQAPPKNTAIYINGSKPLNSTPTINLTKATLEA